MGKKDKDKNKKFSQYDDVEEEQVYKKKPKKIEKTEFELIEEAVISSQNSEKFKNNEKWNRKQKNKKKDRWDDDGNWR